jgi:hypothetical protein
MVEIVVVDAAVRGQVPWAQAADQPPVRRDAIDGHTDHARVHRELDSLEPGRPVSLARQILLVYLGAYVVVRYGLSALYLIGRSNVSARRKVVLFLLGTPAAIVLNIILLVPTRYVALGKLFDNRWQTRELSATQISQFRGASLINETA